MSSNESAQPSTQQSYTTKGNASTAEPAEHASAQDNAASTTNDATVASRKPTSGATDDAPASDNANSTALGAGVRGAGPGEEAKGKTHEDVSRDRELDGEQMGSAGEGKTASAVKQTTQGAGGGGAKEGGAGGEGTGEGKGKEDGEGKDMQEEREEFTNDLERKKAEQAPLRKKMKEERAERTDVESALSKGAPAAG